MGDAAINDPDFDRLDKVPDIKKYEWFIINRLKNHGILGI
jgi:hypothetical protein